jgi:hypothetical protein
MTVAKAKGKALMIVIKNYSTGFTYDHHNNFRVQATGLSVGTLGSLPACQLRWQRTAARFSYTRRRRPVATVSSCSRRPQRRAGGQYYKTFYGRKLRILLIS